MTAACREAGLPDPRLEEIATRFRATIFATQINRPKLDDIDQAIVDGLSDGEGKLTSELAAVIGLTSRATRPRLARLVGNGLVREVGSGPQKESLKGSRLQEKAAAIHCVVPWETMAAALWPAGRPRR